MVVVLLYLPGTSSRGGGFLPAVHHLKNDLYVPVNPLAIGGELDAAARPPAAVGAPARPQGVDHLTDRGLGGVELVSRFVKELCCTTLSNAISCSMRIAEPPFSGRTGAHSQIASDMASPMSLQESRLPPGS